MQGQGPAVESLLLRTQWVVSMGSEAEASGRGLREQGADREGRLHTPSRASPQRALPGQQQTSIY